MSVVRSLRDCRIKVSIAVPSDNNNHLQEALPHDVAGGCCDPLAEVVATGDEIEIAGARTQTPLR